MTFYKAFGTVAAVLFVFVAVQGASAQGRLPAPIIYSGAVTISGAPLTDGLVIRAHVRDYTSEPRAIVNGRYEFLVVQPPDDSYNEEIITFTIDGVKAVEFDTFVFESLPKMDLHFDLTLLALPQPTPTVITIPPTPTPTPTPTPQIARPSAYSGGLIIAGGQVPEIATLVARIGPYESLPAFVEGSSYSALVVDPRDFELVGTRVVFVLNGVVSSIAGAYTSGESFNNFDLIFVDFPTPTPIPTATPTSTATPEPTATNTPFPPTATPTLAPIPPTAVPTRVPPTRTAIPTRTATPRPTVISTATPTPRATSTPRPAPTFEPANPPTPTPEPSTGGMCSSVGGDVGLAAGAGNLFALFGPLGLIVVGRTVRRKR